jgi:hypothetical protein
VTEEEALVLTRYVRACCPQQAIDKYTPDAWYELLKDLDAGDCKLAVEAVARRQPFVAAAEIRGEANPRGPDCAHAPPGAGRGTHR